MLFYLKNIISGITGKIANLDRAILQRAERYILAFHRVIPECETKKEYIQAAMWTSPQSFEMQIQWMLNMGEIVDIDKILDFDNVNRRPLFSITFDDGWRDNYDFAFPILRKYGVTATIFVATSSIETGFLFWPEEIMVKTATAIASRSDIKVRQVIRSKLVNNSRRPTGTHLYRIIDKYIEYLKELTSSERREEILDYFREIGASPTPLRGPILTWKEISEMSMHGILFGSHGHTHSILSKCEERELTDELQTSRAILEARINRPIDKISYPCALYKSQSTHLLEEAGYNQGFILNNQVLTREAPRYFLPRVCVYERILKNPSFLKFILLGQTHY